MIPIDSQVMDRLEWIPVGGEALDLFVEGMTIVGSEPIDYPLTDGVILYLRAADGRMIALDIGVDIFSTDPEGNPFYVNVARIPGGSERS